MSHGAGWALTWGVATHVGNVRKNNEDSVLVVPPVFVVADGMGGHAAGEVASSLAVEQFRDVPMASIGAAELERRVQLADASIRAAAEERPDLAGMGTTVVVLACIDRDGGSGTGPEVVVVHVGDSRAYRWRGGTLARLTADHSVAGDLLRAGELAEDEARSHPARHVLTRALGTGPPSAVERAAFRAEPADRFVLCSDGLNDELDDAGIAAVLGAGDDATAAAERLVAAALGAGGRDNVSVIVLDVVPAPGGAGGPAGDISAADTAPMERPVPPR
ncbi:MAG: protein phosphatase 2C domain-containing protein [Actinomycetota bacterium]|nr:protein phosphatase 2C domain-containing protein [Actinomycetota bacterium]